MQSPVAPGGSGVIETFVRNLSGRFRAASLDWKARDRLNAIACRPQGLQALAQSKAERADNSCGDEGDAGRGTFSA